MSHRPPEIADTIQRLNERDIGAASTRLLFLQHTLAQHGVQSAWIELRMRREHPLPRGAWWRLLFWIPTPIFQEEQTVYWLQVGDRFWSIHGQEMTRDGILDHYQQQGWTTFSLADRAEAAEKRYYARAFAEIHWKGKAELQRQLADLSSQVQALDIEQATQCEENPAMVRARRL